MANRYSVPIPEPTEEGKVLTVVNGEWQSAEASGAGLVVNILLDEESNKPYLDKNYEEISASVNNGVAPLVLATASETGDVDIFRLASLFSEESLYGVSLYFVTEYDAENRTLHGTHKVFVSESSTGTLVESE